MEVYFVKWRTGVSRPGSCWLLAGCDSSGEHVPAFVCSLVLFFSSILPVLSTIPLSPGWNVADSVPFSVRGLSSYVVFIESQLFMVIKPHKIKTRVPPHRVCENEVCVVHHSPPHLPHTISSNCHFLEEVLRYLWEDERQSIILISFACSSCAWI
ncbi:hypothetical protein JTE90_026140 [Oedothorax gibbosus]|uniref:Uncharacterized protein n=1 Tax=Oedothorax gibbosus TaxID=931172 RepID=A0AAV6UZX9_9ARAC|nr:hypothetical protein JTE90_026140 [Oedothorax gibbosus]